jgi:hypothetical protein
LDVSTDNIYITLTDADQLEISLYGDKIQLTKNTKATFTLKSTYVS